MKIAKIFMSEGLQAVDLPDEYRMQGDEVKISRQGKRIILEPIDPSSKKSSKPPAKSPETA